MVGDARFVWLSSDTQSTRDEGGTIRAVGAGPVDKPPPTNAGAGQRSLDVTSDCPLRQRTARGRYPDSQAPRESRDATARRAQRGRHDCRTAHPSSEPVELSAANPTSQASASPPRKHLARSRAAALVLAAGAAGRLRSFVERSSSRPLAQPDDTGDTLSLKLHRRPPSTRDVTTATASSPLPATHR